MNLRLRYIEQRQASRKREISFLLTFEEWLEIWRRSGHLDARGRGSDAYCMARFGDVGPYSVDNVMIITNHQNIAQAQLGRICPEHSVRMTGEGNPRFGTKHSKAAKEVIAKKVGDHWRGVPKTPQQKVKMSLARKAWWERQRLGIGSRERVHRPLR
jgi:hypothetical protein